MLSGAQCVAARGLIGWKQKDLSQAIMDAGGRLSVTAITAFERGGSIRSSNEALIKGALEAAGVQFLETGEVAGGVGVAILKKDET